ncbi:MAG: VOC family protein [Candidatus Peribacteraceae bacterium]|nr:VOC family protein [Candidatus Peribacteraceae bacterium]
MKKDMHPVVHFEMPAKDRKRMAEFYQNVFGWETKQLGPEMGDYMTVTTTETDEQRMIKTPGAINGGFFSPPADDAAQHPSLVIATRDINATVKDITAAGGKVLGEPMEIPGIGMFVSFIDSEGNRCSTLQPKNMM